MSLLANEVYANAANPLWVSVNGGTVQGPLNIKSPNGAIDFLDASGNQISRIVAAKPPGPAPPANEGVLYLQSDYGVAFSRQDQSAWNTALYIDPYNGEDLLDVGGQVNTEKLGVSADPASGMAGFGSIPIGATNVVIPNTIVESGDLIFLTRVGAASAGPGNGVGQGGLIVNPALIIDNTSFRVDLIDPATGISVAAATTTADFNWLIIKTFT